MKILLFFISLIVIIFYTIACKKNNEYTVIPPQGDVLTPKITGQNLKNKLGQIKFWYQS